MQRLMGSLLPILLLTGLSLAGPIARAQENYEIEVYGSDTLGRGENEVELHSNFTFDGADATEKSGDAEEHALHETVEVAHGFTNFFEVGLYFLTTSKTGYGIQYVGNHIRPKVRIPEEWHWPLGLSLSTEVGYQRGRFSADTWSLELAPIVDRSVGHWYFSYNPTFERSLHGVNERTGFEFSNNFKVSRAVSHNARLGAEYYGSLGPLGGFDPFSQQHHQLVPTLDWSFRNKWEMNVGYGFGLTGGSNEHMLKMILGRRFGGKSF